MFEVNGERIALVTDTACDLSDEQLAASDIRTVPLRVNTSKGELRDRLEITPEELYTIMESELPKTSLPSPDDIAACYRQAVEDGADRILHLSISSGLSGTFNIANTIAADFPEGLVTVLDTKTLSAGEGLLVLSAAESLRSGHTIAETAAGMERLRAGQLGCFVIPTLEYLRKGGRIGLVEGIVGNLLQIKPVIYVDDDGVYETLVKGRGFRKAVSAMNEQFFERYAGRRINLAIVHGGAYEEAVEMRKLYEERLDIANCFISPVSPALAIHTGKGLLGAIAQDAV